MRVLVVHVLIQLVLKLQFVGLEIVLPMGRKLYKLYQLLLRLQAQANKFPLGFLCIILRHLLLTPQMPQLSPFDAIRQQQYLLHVRLVPKPIVYLPIKSFPMLPAVTEV